MTDTNSLYKRYQKFTRPRGWLVLPISSTVLVAGWLFWPSLWDPYVRIPSSELEFALNCVPSMINIEVLTAYATQRQAQVALVSKTTRKSVAVVALLPVSDSGRAESTTLHLTANSKDLIGLINAGAQQKEPTEFVYTVLFERVPYLDIQDINFDAKTVVGEKCLDEQYKGPRLMQIIKGHSAVLMHFSLIQDKLSSIVLVFNNVIANIVLSLMLVAWLWFAYIASSGAWQRYVTRDATLLKALEERCRAAPEPLRAKGPAAVVKADYADISRRFAFVKAVGPALGFILTVSSLSAALHPSVQAVQDNFRFVSGIQIAVIATFVGLALRIVAQFGQRWHRDLGERKLILLEYKPVPGGSNVADK